MFEQYAGYFWVALFAALVFYGLFLTISAPFLVKKFYRKLGFEDKGKSSLDDSPYQSSMLLNGLNAAHIYAGSFKGYRVEQFFAFPETRHKFTMSRVQRKRNQAMWTVTLLYGDKPLPPFCARPTTVTDAMEYVLKGGNVDFTDDEGFTKRVHVMAEDHDLCRQVLTPKIREYLKNIDPISVETIGPLLVHKSPRQPHDIGSKLQADIEAVVGLYEELVSPEEIAPEQSSGT